MSSISSKPLDCPSGDRPDQLPFWLALLRAPELGRRRLLRWLERPDAPRSLFTESRAELRALGATETLIDYLREPDWRRVERDLAWLDESGGTCLTLDDPAYPALLREIPDPPPALFVLGDPAVLAQRQVAMVGSRNPSPTGGKWAFDIAAELAAAGLCVTSGLALGIDAASHRGALAAGGGTLAVVGTGIDQIYPRTHRALMDRIVATGAVISEFPLGTPPKAANFPRRNRIISGLALGTLVVEATLRSGSLITARLAAEQGREVFAVPGCVHNPLARGCHALIRQGAKLVETVADILEELGGCGALGGADRRPVVGDDGLDRASREVLKIVACEPTSVDTLVAATGLSTEHVTALLVVLELNGYVAATAGGCYCRIT